jgi:hypothetical protein
MPKDMIKQIVLAKTISPPFLSAQAVSVALVTLRPGVSQFRAGRHTSSIAGFSPAREHGRAAHAHIAHVLPPRAHVRLVDFAESKLVLAAPVLLERVRLDGAPRTQSSDTPRSTLTEALLCDVLNPPEHARTG